MSLINISNTTSPEELYNIYKRGDKIGLGLDNNRKLCSLNLMCNNGVRLTDEEIDKMFKSDVELRNGFYMGYDGYLWLDSCAIVPIDSIDERYSTLAYVKPFIGLEYTFCFPLYDSKGRIAERVYLLKGGRVL